MNIKNKIIKWLGGYTVEDMLYAITKNKTPIIYSRIEKQLYPIATEFATPTLDGLDFVKSNLCYQMAEFMFKNNLLSYNVSRDETNDCYIVRAKAYVREP